MRPYCVGLLFRFLYPIRLYVIDREIFATPSFFEIFSKITPILVLLHLNTEWCISYIVYSCFIFHKAFSSFSIDKLEILPNTHTHMCWQLNPSLFEMSPVKLLIVVDPPSLYPVCNREQWRQAAISRTNRVVASSENKNRSTFAVFHTSSFVYSLWIPICLWTDGKDLDRPQLSTVHQRPWTNPRGKWKVNRILVLANILHSLYLNFLHCLKISILYSTLSKGTLRIQHLFKSWLYRL